MEPYSAGMSVKNWSPLTFQNCQFFAQLFEWLLEFKQNMSYYNPIIPEQAIFLSCLEKKDFVYTR